MRSLEPFGVRVRVVSPGRTPETNFGANARAVMGDTVPEPDADLAAQVFARLAASSEAVTTPAYVAEAMWRAVTDPTCPMLLPAGSDAIA